MTAFWLACALLTALALAMVLPPLLRRSAGRDPQRTALARALASGVLDPAEHAQKLAVLDAQNAATAVSTTGPARLAAVAVVVMLPLIAVGLYARLGDPRVFDPEVQSVATAMQQARQAGLPAMDQAIAGLAERLAREPEDLEGWVLLGRAYKSTEHFGQARDAFARALSLAPEDPGLMVEYAEARTLAAPDRRFGEEALDLIERALAIDPDHQRALWLRGIAAYQAGDIDGANRNWEHLLAVLPGDSPVRDSVQQQLAQLRGEAAPGAGAVSDGPVLSVRVALDPALSARVQPDDVLFVYARAPEGSRAPLAIQRFHAGDLPLIVTLSDADAMVPSMNLSSVPEVVVGARISRSGNAQAQSGDLEAVSEPLSSSRAEAIELVIDTPVP